MNVTTSTRSTAELNVLVEVMLNVALKKIKAEKIEPLIVETYRPKERQYYLYGQGRTYAQCVAAGIPGTKAKKYADPSKGKVTWTLDSIHIKRCAVDLIPQRNGVAIWNSQDKQTKKIIEIMQSVGFEAGANWKNSPDSPHFQAAGIKEKSTHLTSTNTNRYITKVIQKKLKEKGFYFGSIDGDWGTGTDTAVKKFNLSKGWTGKAKIGKKGLKAILSD